MVVTEALARGLPVIASAVPDALGDGGLLGQRLVALGRARVEFAF